MEISQRAFPTPDGTEPAANRKTSRSASLLSAGLKEQLGFFPSEGIQRF